MKLNRILMPLILFFSMFIISCGPKDADIKAAVDKTIQVDNGMAGITSSVTGGVVTLTGECESETSKAKCSDLAKSVKGVKSVINNCTVQMPVLVSPDDTLRKNLTDATKDYPGVTASVNDGVVTLTGNISRANLAKLMKSVNDLQPKKVQNQLTIK
ncbi:MAG TPA: BON domain-containing protein [Chitinophagaceae bacterium]|nr:BON domain-containing protein [Chitinophagaceae bacterium]